MSKRTTPARQRGAAKGGKPNVQGMMAQVQQMQQEMEAAQEQLAQETVSASSGGGMVTVEVTGDLRVTSVTIDPEAVDPEDVEMLADMVTRRRQRGAARRPGAGGRAEMGGATGGLDLGGLGGLGLPRPVSSYAPPVQRLVTELSKLPGIGTRTAQRLAFHILRASDEDALGLAEAIREVKERIGLCEVCFNLTDEPRCRICQDTAPRPHPDLRGRGARRRDPDGAHARVPWRLSRARGGAVADRRHRPGGPEDRRAVRARRVARRRPSGRSCSRPTPRPRARRPRCTSLRSCASARPS